MLGRHALLEEIAMVLFVHGGVIVLVPVVTMEAIVTAHSVDAEVHALVENVVMVVIASVSSAAMVVGADHWDVLLGIVSAPTAKPLAMMTTMIAKMTMLVVSPLNYLPETVYFRSYPACS